MFRIGRRGHRAQRGFTLLELLVAVALLALMAIFAWRGLDEILRTRDALVARRAAVETLQRALARIERDAIAARALAIPADGVLTLGDGAITYRVVDGRLLRQASGAAPQVLIEDVGAFSVEALQPDGGWAANVAAPKAPQATIPGAVATPAGADTKAGVPPNAGVLAKPAGLRLVLRLGASAPTMPGLPTASIAGSASTDAATAGEIRRIFVLRP